MSTLWFILVCLAAVAVFLVLAWAWAEGITESKSAWDALASMLCPPYAWWLYFRAWRERRE